VYVLEAGFDKHFKSLDVSGEGLKTLYIKKTQGWEPVHKKYKATNKSSRAQVGGCQRNFRIHEIGQSESASISAPVGP
jgi:hypothetical protein